MKEDIEIASESKIFPIKKIISKLNIADSYITYYGKYKAKIDYKYIEDNEAKKDGKLILVTAISPTKYGEGKTTMSIALAQGLNKIKKKVILSLREPSMGPVFGLKGGATGGGYSQVVPMEDINLHFTGDIHAITACNNLIAAVLDNHIFQGNKLNIDPNKCVWQRCLDVNDRALREVEITLDKNLKRKDSFNISVASEIMAILCLATSINDFKERVGKCIVAYTYDEKPITVKDLGIEGSCAVLMKDAINPNIVQTLEHVPALIHGGPFANIAHGCSSVLATKLGLKLADYVVTEAGFGADLGAEKFLDIKCPIADLKPSAVVIVASIRALKANGEDSLEKGVLNLQRHVENIKKYRLPFIVCVNHFYKDSKKDVKFLIDWCNQNNYPVSFSDGYLKGGKGTIDLANKVVEICENKNNFQPIYQENDDIKVKIEKVCKEIYHAKDVIYAPKALEDLKRIKKLGFDKYRVCIAKTQYSFTDDQNILGAPENFDIHIRELKISAGAGFIVALTGKVMTMPGLPKIPAAVNIDLDEKGNIKGLF